MEVHGAHIKQKALELGFDACGVARATKLESLEAPFSHWLEQGFQGSMAYMERNIEKRLDPKQLFPGAQSVIVLAHNYFPSTITSATARHHPQKINIAKYAWGKDYHFMMKDKLATLIQWLHAQAPGTSSRAFVDSAPVLERAWAVEAGIGWTGKNACLIIPQKGSFFFLGSVITSLAIVPDAAFTKNHCGNCTRCMEACPTGAIVAPGSIDARKCLSYQTIENKEPIPPALKEKTRGWVFGCDICQDICPHNRFSKPHHEPSLYPLKPISEWDEEQWCSMTKAEFNKELAKAGSPIARVKYEKFMDNTGNPLSTNKENHRPPTETDQ
jgi:epoxyqueuosine reductase